ncbi:MAG: PEPxxWA-CTERM sorting domain-containing protein [Caulobacteraceae bacterium]
MEGLRVTSVPVPEPTTWALMLAGVFGLGGVLRSRRRAFRVA